MEVARPSVAPRRRACTSGVAPSPSVSWAAGLERKESPYRSRRLGRGRRSVIERIQRRVRARRHEATDRGPASASGAGPSLSAVPPVDTLDAPDSGEATSAGGVAAGTRTSRRGPHRRLGSARCDPGAGRLRRPAHVLPPPRAIARRSPRTALLSPSPPAPGPLNATRAERLGVDLDPVDDAAVRPKRAVGGDRGRRRPVGLDRARPRSASRGGDAAGSIMSPGRGRPRPPGRVTPVIPGRRRRARRRSVAATAPAPASARRRAGRGSRAC